MLEAFSTELWRDVVVALLHSIWQAALLALLLGLALRQISAKRAALRYWLSVFALLGIILASFFAHHVRKQLHELPATSAVSTSDGVEQAKLDGAASPAVPALHAEASSVGRDGSKASVATANWTAFAAVFWLIGASVMVLRTVGSVFQANQFTSVAPIESGEHLELLRKQSSQMGLSNTPSLWSSATSFTPYTVGVLSPAVVVPLSMLTSLTAIELQAVLAHELAHIRRHDYLVNLFQMVIEAAYFFNPAVWWVSRQIRREREACCDQIAIQSASSRVSYATILANWMETVASKHDASHDGLPVPAIAFADKQPSGMLERIQRILKPEYKPHLRVSPLNWLFVIVVSIGVAGVMNAGSKVVTAAAASVLSHAERVAHIEKNQGNVELPRGVFEEGRTTIRGRITTEDGGEVDSGWIYSKSQNGGIGHHGTETDFRGDQEFELSVRSGLVWLEFFSKNYAPAIIGPIEAIKDQSVIRDVKLTKGKPHLVHVMDEAGNPIAGAKVLMYPESHGGPNYDTRTNDQGDLIYKHRRPGMKSQLSVKKAGYVTQRRVVLNDGETKVTLEKSPVSQGVVLSASGQPVANAEIKIVSVRERSSHIHQQDELAATTDEQGRFETALFSPTGIHELLVTSDEAMAYIEDVSVGDEMRFKLNPACSLDLILQGDTSLLTRGKDRTPSFYVVQRDGSRYWQGESSKGDVEIVEQKEGEVRLRVKRLWPGAFSVRAGEFRYRGIAKPGHQSETVTIQESQPAKATVVGKVDLRIRFRCNGEIVKPGGSLRVGSHHDGFYDLEDGELQVRVEPGKHYFIPSRLIGFTFQRQHVEIGPETSEITIDVEPAGAVSGRVVDHNGDPVSASVSCNYEVRRSGGFHASSLHDYFKSDADGKFLLTPIPLDAQVVVKAGDRFNPAFSDELRIEPGEPIVEVKLQTAKPSSAKVRVVDPSGNPVAGVDLMVSLQRPGGGGWSGDLFSDGKGESEFAPLHPTWKYFVTAKPKKGYVFGGVELLQGKTSVLQLEDGCVVRGRLLDKDGNPLSKRRVYAQAVDASTLPPPMSWVDADRTTDTEGNFEFTRLPKAEFRIKGPNSKEVLVHAGIGTQPIELRPEAP